MEVSGEDGLRGKRMQIIREGKKAFDECSLEMGRMLAETIVGTAKAFGVSASSVSRRLVQATAWKKADSPAVHDPQGLEYPEPSSEEVPPRGAPSLPSGLGVDPVCGGGTAGF